PRSMNVSHNVGSLRSKDERPRSMNVSHNVGSLRSKDERPRSMNVSHNVGSLRSKDERPRSMNVSHNVGSLRKIQNLDFSNKCSSEFLYYKRFFEIRLWYPNRSLMDSGIKPNFVKNGLDFLVFKTR
ncbi:hypothetical protein QMM85_13470, partial [Leptospira santarosai]|uniref:hypothetical protein n=1 Tax=Leptospira santarosai TaxID=28183 RepID=UPI0024AF6453